MTPQDSSLYKKNIGCVVSKRELLTDAIKQKNWLAKTIPKQT